MPGVLAPRANLKITPEPPIDEEHEQAVLLNMVSTSSIKVAPCGGSVELTNLGDVPLPYVLVVVNKDSYTVAGRIFFWAREKLAAHREKQANANRDS